MGRLESQMFDRPKKPGLTPLTPVCPRPTTASIPLVMPTTPSTLRSTAHSGITQSAQPCKNYLYHQHHSLIFPEKKTYCLAWNAVNCVLTGLMVKNDMTVAAELEIPFFNVN